MLIHQESLGRISAAENVGASWHLAGSAELVRRWHPSWYASNNTPYCFKLIRRKDGMSTHIETAMATNQILPRLGITTPSGRVTLSNARVVGIGPWLPPRSGSSSKHGGSADTHEVELVSITFQKIDIENKGSGTAASDDWSTYPP